MKKILMGLAAAGTAIAMVPLFAAFEAHVINVTAKIENALQVSPQEISFGTTFPQEMLDNTFDVSISQSFADETRVDDVEYTIRQKPKCIDRQGAHPQVGEDAQGNFVCPGGSVMMPLLCPYLSKHEITRDGGDTQPLENDSKGINAFHGLPGPWTLATTLATAVDGKLQKLVGDTQDTWDIDLKVPCFSGSCAQDWANFVHSQNPDANPNAYMADPQLEHAVYGCDLWVEVSGVSPAIR